MQDNTPLKEQVTELADFILKYYPGEPGRTGKSEGAIEVAMRLLSPVEVVNNDKDAVTPNWAVDTLAKKELKRLAQFIIDNVPDATVLKHGSIVDVSIALIKRCLGQDAAKKIATDR